MYNSTRFITCQHFFVRFSELFLEWMVLVMTIYERYCLSRDAKGLKDAHVATGTGIGKSTFSDWKSGRSIPKNDKLQKIADFINVPLDYLLTGKETSENDRYYLNDETAKVAQEIFENKELRALFDAAKDAQPEDIQTVHSMLLALKRKELGK